MAAQNDKKPAANVASVIRIPGYKIKGVLGRGGMAVVYLAVQESIGREVALKVLAPDHTDETFSQRFLAEARIISQLSHPNIVTVFDAGVHQGNHYMAMEYVKGKTLTDARDELNLAQRLEVIKQIADALDFAGGKGYVHRDIKPENIMRHEDGRAILMDFGIARSLDVTKGLTVTGKAIGTPYYMSPEQTKGLKVDPRSDIYSLGVVLFQMLAGRVPYDGPSFVAVGIKHISEPIPLLPPGFEPFQQIINNSMSKEAAHRYQKAGDMKRALESLPEAVTQRQPVGNSPASTQSYNAKTVAETAAVSGPSKQYVSSPSKSTTQRAPAFRAERRQADLPPIDVTSSDEFKRLRRRRRLLFLLLLTSLAYAGYQRPDLWLPTWQYDIAPWLLTNIPQSESILRYLPPPKQKPAPVAVMPKPRPKENEPRVVTQPPIASPVPTPPQADVDASIQAPDKIVSQDKQAITTSPEQQQREKIKALQAGLEKYSENALKLAILYKSILVHDQQNAEATKGLADLKQWYGKELQRVASQKDWEHARLLLNMLKESFPAALQEEQFHYFELQTESAEKLQVYLRKAAQYQRAEQLIKPQGRNALDEYQKALQLSPGNTEARQGLNKIADYFYQQARQQQKHGDLQAAMDSCKAGLLAVSDHKKLLALQTGLQSTMQRQLTVQSLLEQANQQLAGGYLLSPQGKSAYDLFQVVLAENPTNLAAKQGLERVERVLVQQIQRLIKQERYPMAQQRLTHAQQYFPQSRALNFLQRRLTRESLRQQRPVN